MRIMSYLEKKEGTIGPAADDHVIVVHIPRIELFGLRGQTGSECVASVGLVWLVTD